MLPTKKRGSLTVNEMKTTKKETREGARATAKRIADKINRTWRADPAIAELITNRARAIPTTLHEQHDTVWVDWCTHVYPSSSSNTEWCAVAVVSVGYVQHVTTDDGRHGWMDAVSPATERARDAVKRIIADAGYQPQPTDIDGNVSWDTNTEVVVARWTVEADSMLSAFRKSCKEVER